MGYLADVMAKAQKEPQSIDLILSPSQPLPLLPYELSTVVSPDVWESRVRAIIRLATRYSKPVFERVWIVIGMLATIIVPFFAYALSLRELNQKNGLIEANIWDARGISFATTIAVWLVFFVPVFAWKYFGYLRVRALLQRWNRDDIANNSSGAALPTWRATTPGVFRDGIALSITLPIAPKPVTFHPDAYLPPYVVPPAGIPPTYDMKQGFPADWESDKKSLSDFNFSDEKTALA